jgi:hypothetical protein
MLLAQNQPVEVLVTTTGTPIWLTLTTLAVSGLALFISCLQYLTHRSETSRVRPNIEMSAIFADNVVTVVVPSRQWAFHFGIAAVRLLGSLTCGWPEKR